MICLVGKQNCRHFAVVGRNICDNVWSSVECITKMCGMKRVGMSHDKLPAEREMSVSESVNFVSLICQ